jgi:predicted helicase
VERFLDTRTEEEARALFRLCAQDQWQYAAARSKLATDHWRTELVEVLYRPFDTRWTVFNRHVAVHRRVRVTRHLLAGENIALAIGRAGQVIGQNEWSILFCTRRITDFNLFRRGGNNLFPLYLYPEAGSPQQRAKGYPGPEAYHRQANLDTGFLDAVARKTQLLYLPDGAGDLRQTFGPEDILHYMYAVFHSSTYRARYAEFLKIDFPRLPLTSNPALFRELCCLGERLVRLHLLETPGTITTRYKGAGNNLVERVAYTCSAREPEMGQVWINETQYFAGVPLAAWQWRIGGYQVCETWLKARKGRLLEFSDIQRYQHIVAALLETPGLMAQIDATIERHGGWPLI